MDLPVPAAHGQAEIVDEDRKLPDLLRVRLVVDAVQEGQLPPAVFLRHRLVCRQHEILDQAGRAVPLTGPDLDRSPLRIQDRLALREIKIDVSPVRTALPEKIRRLLHLLHHGDDVGVGCADFRIIVDDLLHIRVGHAVPGPDHGLTDLVIHDDALGIQLHQAGKGQTVLPFI